MIENLKIKSFNSFVVIMLNNPNNIGTGGISEYTKDRLRKDGYGLLLEAVKAVNLAKKYKTKEQLVLDFSHNYILNVWLKDDEKTKVWRSRYAEKPSRILICALKVAIENEWHKNPVSKYDFKLKVSNEYTKLSSSNVNFMLQRKSSRKIFEVDDMTDTVKLLYLPKKILGVEELAEKN